MREALGIAGAIERLAEGARNITKDQSPPKSPDWL
jgi:hypothetical protein